MPLGEHEAEEVVAGAALGSDAAALQFGDGGGAALDGTVHIAVRGASAEADDHGWLSILRLCLNNRNVAPPLPTPL